ncbi:MAG: hypothetical protein WCI95_03160 [bacterium]
MSVGTSVVAAVITPEIKRVVVSGGPVWYRQLVTATLSGFGSHAPANIVLLVYRINTLVAIAQAPVDNGATCAFSLDTNTAEVGAALSGAAEGGSREFNVYVYDADPTSLELLGMGTMDIQATRDYSAVAPIPPLSSTTLFIGSFAFYDGKTYIRSSTDGLYYEFAAARSGDEVTESLSTVGITIPGSP